MDARSGRPAEVTQKDNIILVKVREIAKAIDISTERVQHILYEKLLMKDVCTRANKNRKGISIQYLEMFSRNPKDFSRRLVIVDETWVHYYTPESKLQSKQWIKASESGSKKAKTVLSAGKVLVTGSGDTRIVVLIVKR